MVMCAVTTGGSWVKGTWGLSMLFATSWEFIIISKKKKVYTEKNPILFKKYLCKEMTLKSLS